MSQGAGLCTLTSVGRVALITLNHPQKLNAMTLDLAHALEHAIDDIVKDSGRYGCVVVTGAGRAFSAGGDLAWLNQRAEDTPSRNVEIMRRFYERFLSIRRLPLPIVCAINGHAIGAGLCFAMACDIRVASARAKMGFTFVGLGLHPGMGATHLVASVAGFETAYRLLLTGDVITGQEAHHLRLVSTIAPDGPEALEKAMVLAKRIANNSPTAVRSLVRSLRMKQDDGLDQALWREAAAQSHGYSTSDFLEGIQAIREKRKPNFAEYEHFGNTVVTSSRL